MTPSCHNALHPVTLQAAGYTLEGFSISAIATWIVVKELDVLFDAGECALSAVSVRNVLLTHIHGDHSRCLIRHWQLRNMFGLEQAAYTIPGSTLSGLHEIVSIEAEMEGIPADKRVYPDLRCALEVESLLPHRKDLWYRSFPVAHRVDSVGYTIGRTVQKLKLEYLSLTGNQIGTLRKGGTEVTTVSHIPLVTFIGDCASETLTEAAHIWDSKLLILECTFVEDDDQDRAVKTTHTHLRELIKVLTVTPAPNCEALVLKHFSLRDDPARIRQLIREQVPENWKDRIHIFLPPE